LSIKEIEESGGSLTIKRPFSGLDKHDNLDTPFSPLVRGFLGGLYFEGGRMKAAAHLRAKPTGTLYNFQTFLPSPLCSTGPSWRQSAWPDSII